jgi:hypothetical protein
MDDDTNVAWLKPVVGNGDRKNHSVMFPNHDCGYSNGWAVTGRRKSMPTSEPFRGATFESDYVQRK